MLLCVFVFIITGPVMSASSNNLLKSWHASKLTCNLQETLPLSLGLSSLSLWVLVAIIQLTVVEIGSVLQQLHSSCTALVRVYGNQA